jgi:Clp amino terminal domain, pathogenicity island component/UvrB/uvrC motif
MFERFTDRARRVVVLAQEEARMLNHNYIGTEHLLIGLIREDRGVAGKGLESLGISVDAVRQQVEEMIGMGEQAPSGHVPFTPRAKKVLELSLREALQLGHDYIGPGHIMLGLIREGDGVAAQVLVRLGADLNQVRQQVIQRLHGFQGEDEPGSIRVVQRPGLLSRIDAMERRLSALEQRVGTRLDVQELDREIAQVRRDKEAAIEVQDFENAAVLGDRERQLEDDRTARQREWADLPSLSDEIERLHDLLRQHGIDPQGGAA